MKITLPRVTRVNGWQTSLISNGECGGGVNLEMFTRKPYIQVTDTPMHDVTIEYPYAGKGVDYVVIEGNSMVDGDHPEYLDEHGVSRFQKIHWPTASGTDGKWVQKEDYYNPTTYPRGHANGTASVAAGRYFGLAKEAHVYVISTDGFTAVGGGSMAIYDALNMLAEWHIHKNTGRPTVVSLGTIIVTQMVYSGAMGSFSKGGAKLKANTVANEFKISTGARWEYSTQYNQDVAQTWISHSAAMAGALRRAINAGVTVCVPANNNSAYVGVPGSEQDSHGVVIAGGFVTTKSRAFMPDEVIIVGALSNQLDNNQEVLATYSTRGPGVDLYAPVGLTPATIGRTGTNPDAGTAGGAQKYTQNPNAESGHYYGYYNGTSAASPMVAGLACCFLSAMPHLTPAQLKAAMKAAATTGRIKVHDDLEDFGDWENTMCPNPLFPYYPFGGGVVEC